eukprot:11600554-Alexandrium_andersonii.AAC.1
MGRLRRAASWRCSLRAARGLATTPPRARRRSALRSLTTTSRRSTTRSAARSSCTICRGRSGSGSLRGS